MSDYASGLIPVLSLLAAYIGFIVIASVAVYVLYGFSYMKALKALGYDKPWMAWIPFANYYGMADSVTEGEENVHLFGNIDVPVMVYKLWWIGAILVPLIPVIGSLLSLAVTIIFRGNVYGKMYARLENKTEQETQVVGYLSGWIPLIAVVKFLTGKYE